MKVLTDKNIYESMVVLSSHCTEVELKEIAFSYAQQLKKLGASDISVISRGSLSSLKSFGLIVNAQLNL